MITDKAFYVAFKNAVSSISGAAVEGLLPRKVQHFINMAIVEFTLAAVAGSSEINPLKTKLLIESLSTAHREYDQTQMMSGTPNNGALRLSDRDFTDRENMASSDKYATLVGLPEEVLTITNETLDIVKGDEVRNSIDVLPVTLTYYSRNINNSDLQPGIHVTWSYLQRAFTVSGDNTEDGEGALANISESALPSIKGMRVEVLDGTPPIEEIQFNYGVQQLICAKDYKPLRYTIFYTKRPNSIVIDLYGDLSVHSDLPSDLKGDIVDIARRLYVASLADTPQGYQIVDSETKK